MILLPEFAMGVFWPVRSPHYVPTKWANDVIVIRTNVEFSFLDRIRILISGRARLETMTNCEIRPGRVETTAAVFALPPRLCRVPRPASPSAHCHTLADLERENAGLRDLVIRLKAQMVKAMERILELQNVKKG